MSDISSERTHGLPSQSVTTDPVNQSQLNFAQWFGASKAIDASGAPLRCYHGTATDFTAFNPEAEGITGIFFSSSPEVALEYATWRAEHGGLARILPVYLSIENPAEITGWSTFDAEFFQECIDQAKAAGHDGVIFRDVDDGWTEQAPVADTYVVFRPEQIKSASANTGAYSRDDPDITDSRALRAQHALAWLDERNTKATPHA